ncbi:hypothetical protein [Microseira wollei]|uniref:hypothetical protein n=1 Tax=Microseira wollei TaxID=467598 RepID=UPI001CFCDA0C|nr:hypothetical protein [Microseira wollei]
MFEDITAIRLLALANVQGRRDAGKRGRGDNGKTRIETPSELERMNQKIQEWPQTIGTDVPDGGLETLVSLGVSVSPRPRVFFADAKIVQG